MFLPPQSFAAQFFTFKAKSSYCALKVKNGAAKDCSGKNF